ncbi:NAD-dependent epimerase/dehydratase family protein [Nocardia sp. NPDC059764]|uniref:NAD-dependent epimerase/dehydratase family protein n=1 Tax=Nocardia sp. NPDC059764 TaxID=3346939 RepID=UPI0036467D1D
MRVLVTGANGYLGRAVVVALSAAGHEPVAMIRAAAPPIPGAAEVRTADLLDEPALARALRDADSVCHLAGLTRARESLSEPLRYFRGNTTATLTLLEAMSAAGVPRLVFASTAAIYGTPDRQPMAEDLPDAPPHPYARSKLAAELAIEGAAQAGDLAAVILRLSNIAGGADPDPTRLIPRTLAAASGNSPLAVNGDGTAVRDYLHVDDAAHAVAAAVDHLPAPGAVARYIIGSGRGTSILEVVASVERVTGRRVALDHRPPAPEPPALVVDPSKAIAEMDWKPTHSTIEAIIRDTATESPHGVRRDRTSGS